MASVSKWTTERPIAFGPESGLIGILSKPVLSDKRERPAIICLNTGIFHRVGHNRMYVELSRRLSHAGYTALRFDMSGIGDSLPRTDAITPLKASLLDIENAIDFVVRGKFASRVILVGLCSGADHSILYAQSDPRVAGLVLLDPTLPRTLVNISRYFARRVGRFGAWTSFMRGGGLAWQLLRRPRGSAEARGEVPAGWQDVVQLEYAYDMAFRKNIHLFAAFTCGRPPLRVPWAARKRVQMEFFDTSDHTFQEQSDRHKLCSKVRQWADRLSLECNESLAVSSSAATITEKKAARLEALARDVQLEDECEGYDLGANFELSDGQIWQQTSSQYYYRFRYRPKAKLDASGTSGRISIDGCNDQWVSVRRIS